MTQDNPDPEPVKENVLKFEGLQGKDLPPESLEITTCCPIMSRVLVVPTPTEPEVQFHAAACMKEACELYREGECTL